VEGDIYLQNKEEECPTEFVTTRRHSPRVLTAKRACHALTETYGPTIFLQQQMMHNSFSMCHPCSELCAKSAVDPDGSPGLLTMAAAGSSVWSALASAGYDGGHASVVHVASCFRWQPLDLSTASEGEIQWALRGPLFQSHRISVTGSAATSVQPRSQHQNPDDQVSVRVRARLKVGAYRVRFS